MYLNTIMTLFNVSSSSDSSGFLVDFFKRKSQYLANNSGDLLDEFANRVNELLLINLPQA